MVIIKNTNFEELYIKEQGLTIKGIVVSDKTEKEYSDTNKLVNFTGDDVKIGSIVNVEITEAKTWSLDGKVSKQ